MDQLPSDVLPLLFCCPTKQAFENFARTCKALKASSECKKLLVTKRKLVWRDKIARNEAVLRHGGMVWACSFSADGARVATRGRGAEQRVRARGAAILMRSDAMHGAKHGAKRSMSIVKRST